MIDEKSESTKLNTDYIIFILLNMKTKICIYIYIYILLSIYFNLFINHETFSVVN